MAVEIGSILEGKVTGITKFGAFVSLPDGKSGLVHISEVANAYVTDVHEHLQIGQSVKVRVMNVTDDGKINLSIKRAVEEPERPRQEFRRPAAAKPPVQPHRTEADPPSGDRDFEDRLKKFMQESDSRIADNRIYAERRQKNRRR